MNLKKIVLFIIIVLIVLVSIQSRVYAIGEIMSGAEEFLQKR